MTKINKRFSEDFILGDHKTKKFQVQNTTQRRFSQILKNDSVIDNTSITDTLRK